MTFTSTLVCGIMIVTIAAGLSLRFLKTRVTTMMEHSLAARLIIAGAEVFLAAGLTAVGNLFDLFKGQTWDSPSVKTALGLSLMILILCCYAGTKILATLTKEKDQKTIGDLKDQIKQEAANHETQLGKTNAEVAILRKQRDWAARVRELVSNVVAAKMNRLREAKKTKGDQFGIIDFFESIDPQRQIQVILTALHAMIERMLDPSQGYKLRLGVYLSVDGYLQPIYSFDGTTQTCFSEHSRSYMRIDEPEGARSLMTQLYHKRGEFCRVIPNCALAEKNGEFEYFRPEQKEYIKSMVAAKKKVAYPTGMEIAILTMDTNQADFFKHEDREEIEACCNEILKRLEFELLCFKIRPSIQPLATPPNS